MNIKKTLVPALLLVAAVVLWPALSMAQPPPPPPPVDTPIDGGLTLLLAAGAAYGVKKVREARKQNKVADKG